MLQPQQELAIEKTIQ